jgi:hypothetical protein
MLMPFASQNPVVQLIIEIDPNTTCLHIVGPGGALWPGLTRKWGGSPGGSEPGGQLDPAC